MHSVPTQGDSTYEPNGEVTVTVETGTGYAVGTASLRQRDRQRRRHAGGAHGAGGVR